MKRQEWQLASDCLGLAKSRATSGWTPGEGTRAESVNVMAFESDRLLAS